MLTRLAFTNFKAFPEVDIELAPVTVLFGPNSSGKSTIQQFLLMLKQTKEAPDRALSLHLGGPYVDLGDFADIIHRHDEKKTLTWAVEWEYWEAIKIIDPEGNRREALAESSVLTVQGEIESQNGAPTARNVAYTLGDHTFGLRRKTGSNTEFESYAEGPSGFRFKRTLGRKWALPGPVKSYGFPDQARTYYQNAGFLADLEAAFEDQLTYVYYLGPLREPPKRNYTWTRSRPTDVGLRGERVVEAILAATADDERRNLKKGLPLMPFQAMIAHWLRDMGLVNSFRVEEIAPGTNYWRVKLTTSGGAPEVLLTDVGFGISQVLPVITLLYYVSEGSTVLIEQPELHLHPRAQTALADLILAVAERRELQVIVETHSEHLLLRLQRRIAETAEIADRVRLYVAKTEQGHSVVEPLELDDKGQIANWPPNFFGDAFSELAAAEEARIKREMGE